MVWRSHGLGIYGVFDMSSKQVHLCYPSRKGLKKGFMF